MQVEVVGGGEDTGSLGTCKEESTEEDGLKFDHSF